MGSSDSQSNVTRPARTALAGFRVRALIGVLALMILVPAQAGATTTFGANLGRVPDDWMVDCTILPPWGVPTYANTCTWFSNISDNENDIVPLGVGVITRARVRVGSHTGPMQFALGRAQLDRNKEPGYQLLCCVWRAAGPVFTPAPNAITTVTLNEPVLHVRDFQSNQDEWDNLALSVLAPGVPIPAAPVGAGGLNITSTAGACWPAVQALNTYCAPGGPGRYAVLFNADWNANIAVKLAAQLAPVRNNAASVRLICRLLQQCAGLLRLQNGKAPGARIAAAAGKTVTYGSARVSDRGGQDEDDQGQALQRRPRADAPAQEGDGLGQYHDRERSGAAGHQRKGHAQALNTAWRFR